LPLQALQVDWLVGALWELRLGDEGDWGVRMMTASSFYHGLIAVAHYSRLHVEFE
jgi:hypothetical protein